MTDSRFEELMAAVALPLDRQLEGEPATEEEHEAAYLAATVLASAELVRRGFSLDRVEELMTSRPYKVRVAVDAEEFTIELEWLDSDDDEASENGGGS